MTDRFGADWLALREPFDHAARSTVLARRLAERLPRRPRLLDLGAGTGSMFRFLAPLIGRGQDWLLVDADETLLDEAFGRTSAWARRRGYAATAEGDVLQVSTSQGLWRMQVALFDLSSSRPWPGFARLSRLSPHAAKKVVEGRSKPGHEDAGDAADGVVCSALLDLVTAAGLTRLAERLTVPLLACLTVDGRDAWRPSHPSDVLVRSAFRRDQRRDKGFGPALGTAAPSTALRILAERGFVTASAPSDWQIPRTALSMQRALVEGTVKAARGPDAGVLAAWQEARLRQALRGRLAITIGHRDILALPPGG